MRYRRVKQPGGCYFFTVVIQDRSQSLLTDHVDKLRSAFSYVKQRHPFSIEAIVILPDHLHTIWTLPEGDGDYSKRWHLLKTSFSKSLKLSEAISPSRGRKGERGIWQRRFWEHLIRDEEDLRSHIDYIHYNPVKHGLVEQVGDWPYSSFHKYVRNGVLPEDWGSDVVEVRCVEIPE